MIKVPIHSGLFFIFFLKFNYVQGRNNPYKLDNNYLKSLKIM
ncbi:hypothetical protein B0I03_101215 [Flavobacterium aquaticum]|uniref:Uncharacterized protein n=1 Tax=Flavobacterium aquaticum TaxID=1236486 RepID=A0A327YZ69_9FLAO|nr:hypothetical protein B0I03_101215 [Flavobacterium aquaticum]